MALAGITCPNSPTPTPVLPNLKPFQPVNWDAPFVVAKSISSFVEIPPNTADVFDPGDPTFIGWAITNASDQAIVLEFQVGITVDGDVVFVFPVEGLGARAIKNIANRELDAMDSSIPHTIGLLVDLTEDVDESDEGDNALTITPQWLITPTPTTSPTPTPTPTHTPTVTLTPTGKIVFVAGFGDNEEIYTIDADGSNRNRLTNNGKRDSTPSMSADGTKIAFTSERDGNEAIYVMNVGGSDLQRKTNDTDADSISGWSPDGTMTAFLSGRDDNREIYVKNSYGSNERNVTNHSENDLSPVWSPDGLMIAFDTLRDDASDIYVMNADGSIQTDLMNEKGPSDNAPDWSHAGSQIEFQSGRDGPTEIYVMEISGENVKRLTTSEANNIVNWSPAWSPDDAKIVFSSNRNEESNLYVMNKDGSSLMKLTDDFGFVRWPEW